MNSNILTRNELNELLEIIHSLILVEDRDQFMGVARSLADLIEFDFIIFGIPESSFVDKAQPIVDLNVSYPQDWVDLYQENKFYRIDPVVLAIREEGAPQHWVDIMNPFLLEMLVQEKRREMLEEAKRRRLLAVYNTNNLSVWKRLQLTLGNFFISFGERLKYRYSSQLPVDRNEQNL
jgi:hypothetical protein